MKKIIKYTGIIAASALLLSCANDNYEQPNASIFGEARDAETGELILQDLGANGSRIDIIEQGYENPQTRQLNFKTDGTYRENNMFKGTYLIRATRTNFIPIEEEIIEVNGETRYDFVTLPYCRIKVDSIGFNTKKQQVWASFQVERTTSDNLETVRLFCDANPNVSLGINGSGDNSCKIDVKAANDPERTFVLKMPVDMLDDGGSYYFRIGALTSVAEARWNYTPAVKLTIVKGEVEEDPVVRPGIAFDECEDANGWGGTFPIEVDTKNFKTGSAAIRTTSTKGGVTQFFKKALDTPINFSEKIPMGGAHLLITMYVDGADHLPRTNAGQIELTSGGTADKEEICWTFDQFELQDGWNELDLPFSISHPTGGFDLSRVNFFRMYHAQDAGNTTIILDEIRVYYPTMMLTCDDAEGWRAGGATVTLDEANKKEGEGSISSTAANGGTVVFMQHPFSTPYVSGVTRDNGWLKCWLYISDAETFNKGAGGQFEITSGGAPDNQELSWRFGQEIPPLEDGWNEIKLQMSKGNLVGGTINLNAINFIRIYQGSLAKGLTIKLDAVQIYQDGFEPVDE